MARIGEVCQVLDELWPASWAEEWDNVGLLVGDRQGTVHRCFCALDADGPTIAAAIASGAELVISHHPLPFRPIRSLTEDSPTGAALLLAGRERVSLFACHTNLDVAPSGVSFYLAQALGVEPEPGRPILLRVTGRDPLYKLIVFVPAGHEDSVLRAMADAGAGHVGNYSHCSFAAPGTGTFRPLEGAHPFIGQVGSLERQSELRLEVILPAAARRKVVAALLAAHPYEEVAYDLIRLENEGEARGYGFVGTLPRSVRLSAFAARVARRLEAPATRFVGDPERSVRRVAVVGGAGVDFADDALAHGADVLVTADVRYHEARSIEAKGLCLVDPGHQGTEAVVVPAMAAQLRDALRSAQLEVEVLVADPRADVWHVPRVREP